MSAPKKTDAEQAAELARDAAALVDEWGTLEGFMARLAAGVDDAAADDSPSPRGVSDVAESSSAPEASDDPPPSSR